MLGLFLPVGDGGVLPVVNRLFKKGIPPSIGIAFLFSAPSFNLIAIASTLAAFGPGLMLWGRIGLTLITAITAGLIFSLEDKHRFIREDPENNDVIPPLIKKVNPLPNPLADKDLVLPARNHSFNQAVLASVNEFTRLGGYLVLGAIFAAGIRTIFSQAILLNLGPGVFLRVGGMVVLSVLYSSSSLENAFSALGFSGNVPFGPLLAFIVLGPMVDIKRIPMLFKIFQPRIAVFLTLVPLLMVLFLTLLVAYRIG